MKWLTKPQILRLHTALSVEAKGLDGLRDEGMLDSALQSPLQTFGGIELYPTVPGKAVRLGYELIRNHPFLDGNKRIGVHAMLVTLTLNGIDLTYDGDNLIRIVMQAAAGETDETGLRTWVEQHTVK